MEANQKLKNANLVGQASLPVQSERTNSRAGKDARATSEKNYLVGEASLPVQSKNKQTPQKLHPDNPKHSIIKDIFVSRRHLPHWQIPGSVYFITFRTHKNYKLNEDEKRIIFDSIMFHNKTKYFLYAFVIMSDHVHIILQPNEINKGEYVSLSEIMHSIKSYSASEIRKSIKNEIVLHKEHEQAGMPVLPVKVFQDESYDRIIRTEDELKEKMNYIHNNPIKKGLCEDGYNYKWFYVIGKE